MLSGTVLSLEDGTPLSGLVVRASFKTAPAGANDLLARNEDLARLENFAGGEDLTEEVTGPDGTFLMALPGGCLVQRIEVFSSSKTAPRALDLSLHILGGAEESFDLFVSKGAVLNGVVVTHAGEPMPGARVRCWAKLADRTAPADRVVFADGRGRFHLEGVGPQVVIHADGEGWGSEQGLMGEVPVGGTVSGLTLKVAPTTELAGRVVNSMRLPVADAAVVVSRTNFGPPVAALCDSGALELWQAVEPDQTVLSGPDGRFSLPATLPGEQRISVTDGVHVRWFGIHDPRDGLVEVVLQDGLSVRGLVVDDQDQPVKGATVTVGGRGQRQTTTDAGGRFEVCGLAPQRSDPAEALRGMAGAEDLLSSARAVDGPLVWLLASGPGYALGTLESIPLGKDLAHHLTIRLGPGFALAGRVVNGEGARVSGARVEVMGDRVLSSLQLMHPDVVTTPEWLAGSSWTETDSNGYFRFEGLTDAVYGVRAWLPGHRAGFAYEEARPGGDDIVISLGADESESTVVLMGTVEDALTGEPLRAFTVTTWVPTGVAMAGRSHEIMSPTGGFIINDLRAGSLVITVASAGYNDWHTPLGEYQPGEHAIRAKLAASATLRLRMVSLDGQPVAGATVSVVNSEGQLCQLHSGPTMTTSSLMADSNGEIDVRGLPQKQLTVIACASPALTVGQRAEEVRVAIDLSIPQQFRQEIIVPLLQGAERADSRPLLLNLGLLGGNEQGPAEVGQLLDRETAQRLLHEGTAWVIDTPSWLNVFDGSGGLVDAGSLEPLGLGQYAAQSLAETRMTSSPVREGPSITLIRPSGTVRLSGGADGYRSFDRVLPDVGNAQVQNVIVLLVRP